MNKVIRTALILGLITGIVVFFIVYKNDQTKKTKIETGEVEVKEAPEKQLVKPDDVIEESIIGGENQEVVGVQTMVKM